MTELEKLHNLASQAAQSPHPPMGDIAERVLADIRRGHAPADRRVWQATAVATGALAVIASVWAAQSWSSMLNPLSDLGDRPASMELR